MNNINFLTLTNIETSAVGNASVESNSGGFLSELAKVMERFSEEEKNILSKNRNGATSSRMPTSSIQGEDTENNSSYISPIIFCENEEVSDLEILILMLNHNRKIVEKTAQLFDSEDVVQASKIEGRNNENSESKLLESTEKLLTTAETYLNQFEELLKVASELLSSEEKKITEKYANDTTILVSDEELELLFAAATVDNTEIDRNVKTDTEEVSVKIEKTGDIDVENGKKEPILHIHSANPEEKSINELSTNKETLPVRETSRNEQPNVSGKQLEVADSEEKLEKIQQEMEKGSQFTSKKKFTEETVTKSPTREQKLPVTETAYEKVELKSAEKVVTDNEKVAQVEPEKNIKAEKVEVVQTVNKESKGKAEEVKNQDNSKDSKEVKAGAENKEIASSSDSKSDKNSGDSSNKQRNPEILLKQEEKVAAQGVQPNKEVEQKQAGLNKQVNAEANPQVEGKAVENKASTNSQQPLRVETKSDTTFKEMFSLKSDNIQNNFQAGQSDQAKHVEQTMRWESAKDVVKLAKLIQQAGQNGATKLTVRLNPEHLGRLEIQLIEVAGKLNARIIAQSNETKNIMSSHGDAIRQALVDKGIQINNMDFQFHDAFTKQEQNSEEKNAQHAKKGKNKGNSNNDDTQIDLAEEVQPKRQEGLYA